MKQLEKREIINKFNKDSHQDKINRLINYGYNEACDDCEAYLKWFCEERIFKIILHVVGEEDCTNHIQCNYDAEKITKAIAKELRGEE